MNKITVTTFNRDALSECLRDCPSIVQGYVAQLKTTLENQRILTNQAISKLRKQQAEKVCEWVSSNTKYGEVQTTGCGCILGRKAPEDFIFCPYCSLKIKEVQDEN